jgi:hypothetical protein
VKKGDPSYTNRSNGASVAAAGRAPRYVIGGTALQGPDYELAERTLTFGPGVTSQSRPCVTLPIANSGVF